jgi:tetratricopeptide (TPR) repeat protein
LAPARRGDAQEPAAGAWAPARMTIDGNAIVGRDAAGAELWAIRHVSVEHLEPRQGELVQAGDAFFYAYLCYLMQVDPARGVIVRRIVFPGRISEFASKGGSLTVIVELPSGDAYKRVPFVYNPGRGVIVGLPVDDEAIGAPMVDAQGLIPGFNVAGFQPGYGYGREAALKKIREGVLDEGFMRNPTNPWFMFFKGMMLKHLERSDDARDAFRAAVSVNGAPAYDYLRMSSLLAAAGEMGESVLAFEHGYAEFVRSGLEPELLMSREAFRRYFATRLREGPGFPSSQAEAVQNAAANGDSQALMVLMEHAARVAPRCEGIAYSFSGAAEHLQEHSRPEDAAVWFARAREAASFSGPVGSRQAMYGATAALIALIAIFLVVAGRAWRLQKKDLAPLGGWLSSWRWPKERFSRVAFAYAGRLELLGILVVAALGFFLSNLVITNEGSFLKSLALPEEAKGGTWGHHNAVAAFESYRGPAGQLLYGIACQQAGKLSDAKKIYEGLRDQAPPDIAAIAANNFGVIQLQAGEDTAAQTAFKDALMRDPKLPEARYNADPRAFVDSARVSRARSYMPGRPIIALPDAAILNAAFQAAPAPEKARVAPVPDDGLGVFRGLTWVTIVLSVAFGALALIFMVMRRRPEPKFEKGSFAWLAYVVPWTSTRFAPFGALLVGLWAYFLITVVQVLRVQFSNVLMSPEQVKEIYGLTGNVVFPFESAIALGGPVALIAFWVVNGLILARTTSARRSAKGMSATQSMSTFKPPADKDKKTDSRRLAAQRPASDKQSEHEPPAPQQPESAARERPDADADTNSKRPASQRGGGSPDEPRSPQPHADAEALSGETPRGGDPP